MKLLAHLTKVNERRKEQSLEEHCIHTAAYALESIGSTKLHHTVYLAGVLHDAGKAKQEYNQYLEDAFQGREAVRGTVNHTFAGVIWLFEQFHTDRSTRWEKLTCEIIGYAVGAHHGLFDCADLDGKNGFVHRLKKDRAGICYEEAITNFFSQVITKEEAAAEFQKAVSEVEAFFNTAKEMYESGEKTFFQISMLIRLVLSAVIYGDRKDTGEFMRQRVIPQSHGMDWGKRRDYFEKKLSRLKSDLPLNQVRNEISMQCLNFAERASGIYRLNVPTGAGKTLCSLRYALAHSERYKKKRIIFIIPLLSVLDQNAKVIRDYMPDPDEVLEHHSNVVHEKETPEKLDRYELLMDSWNAPIIVSTLVQLLQILFSHQTTAVGRMQALCDSVIVIDEVQSLPKKMTVMFNMAVNFLHQFCHASIILSSATQPCFEELKWPLQLAKEPDMVRLTKEQLQIFKRAEIVNDTVPFGMDWDECANYCKERMERHASLLVICNTKSEARRLYEKLSFWAQENSWDMIHLSTAMCQEHRLEMICVMQEKLLEVQNKLCKGEKTRKFICISTQILEAGVDVSFEGVIRVLAGIDNLAQAAGRCNRSGEYGTAGTVYLINLKNEKLSMLHEILSAQSSTRRVLETECLSGEEALIGEQATRRFYRYLFEETENEIEYPIKNYGTTLYLSQLLGNINMSAKNSENKSYCLRQPFLTVGRIFTVFDQDTIDILVPYRQGKQLIEWLKSLYPPGFDLEKQKKVMEQTRKYVISIYEWQRKRLDEAGLLYPILDGRILVLREEAYSVEYGLNDIGQQPVDAFII